MQAINIYQVAGGILAANAGALADLNRKQLMQGKGRDGKPLAPKYSEDPWFKTPQAAANYAGWKHKLYPQTPYDVPNLIITGVYHASISVQASTDSLTYDASASFAGAIAGKYNNNALGLNEDSKHTAVAQIVMEPLLNYVAANTGLKKS